MTKSQITNQDSNTFIKLTTLLENIQNDTSLSSSIKSKYNSIVSDLKEDFSQRIVSHYFS